MLRKFTAYSPQKIASWEDWLLEINVQLSNSDPASLKKPLRSSNGFRLQKNNQQQHEYKKTAIRLEHKIKQGRAFLLALEKEPKVLALDLAEKMAVILREYIKKYYIEDSLYYVLSGYDDKINAILLAHQKDISKNEERVWRERYGLLCGFIWSLLSFQHIFNFSDSLTSLINEIHISNIQTVSNSLNEFSCQKKYLVFKTEHPSLFNPVSEVIVANRFSDFNMALSALKQSTQAENTDLHYAGKLLVKAIDAEIIDQHPKKLIHNLAFYTRILKTAELTISDPLENSNVLSAYLPANFKEARTTNRVTSAVLGFMGASIITTSVLGLTGIISLTLPFTIPGIIIGGILLTLGVTIANSHTTATWRKPFGFFKQNHEEIYNAIQDFSEIEKIMKQKP